MATTTTSRARRPFIPTPADVEDAREVARLSREMANARGREETLNAERDKPLSRLKRRRAPVWWIAEQAELSEEAIYKARSRRQRRR